jgi:hypothetical protein
MDWLTSRSSRRSGGRHSPRWVGGDADRQVGACRERAGVARLDQLDRRQVARQFESHLGGDAAEGGERG